MPETIVRFEEPFERFREVLSEAEATGMADPNAMVVSTVDPEGQPSSRAVLRLHDRTVYERIADGWRVTKRYP